MKKLFYPYCYKKPIPTDINSISQLDFLSRALLREMLSMCRNEPGTEVFIHGNKQFSIDLNRGQMILKIKKIANELGISSTKIRERLNIINKIYTDVIIEGRPFGSIITLKDYDSLIKMEVDPNSKNTSKQYRNNNESATNNKKDNTDKNNNKYSKNLSEIIQLEKLTNKFNPSLSLEEN